MKNGKKLCKYEGTDVILTKTQEKQLKKLLKYVKANSQRLAELYRKVDEDVTLRDLPVVTKELIMKDYDNWITTSDFTLKDLKEFAADENAAGELFQGKYLIAETSGSTGYPFFMAYNRAESEVMFKATNANLKTKFALYRPACFLYPFDKHIISVCTAKHSHRKYPLMRNSFLMKDSNAPTGEIVEFLNQKKPKILCTYVGTAEMLAGEQMKGNLHLKVKEVIVAGENLQPKTRKYIQEAFAGCRVRSLYGSTETSGMAIDCDCGHMHLHNAGVIIEPVDENNRPVPAGQMSHKILVTALREKTVPLIRYEVSDKIAIHNTPCKCGNRAPWIEVEGRSVEPPLIFRNESGEVTVSTFILFVKTMGLANVRKLQLILHGYDRIECRVNFIDDTGAQESFEEIRQILVDSLAKVNVHNVTIYLSDEKPQTDPVTNKFKFSYQII